MSAPGGIGYCAAAPLGERVGAGKSGHTDQAFRLRVVGLHLVVVDGPVDDVGIVDRAELGAGPEVDRAQAGELAVGVEAAAADRRRQVVHLAREQVVAVVLVAPVRAWFQERVGPEEVAAKELDLVVGDVAQRLVRRLEREQVIPALLEHDDRPTRGREHVCRSRARRPGTDDDGVAVAPSRPDRRLRRRCTRAVGRRRRSRSHASPSARGCRRTRVRRRHLRTRARTTTCEARVAHATAALERRHRRRRSPRRGRRDPSR